MLTLDKSWLFRACTVLTVPGLRITLTCDADRLENRRPQTIFN